MHYVILRMANKSLLSLSIACLIVTAFACRNAPAPVSLPDHATGKINFGFLRYDSAALEYRLDSIHNRGLVFQFCLKEVADNNNTFQLISYAFDTLNDYNNSWMPDTLAIIADSIPKNFSGPVAMGNHVANREQLYNVVRDGQGERFSYDYVLFTPVVEGVLRHLVYHMVPIKNGQRVPGSKMQITTAMPPTRVWE